MNNFDMNLLFIYMPVRNAEAYEKFILLHKDKLDRYVNHCIRIQNIKDNLCCICGSVKKKILYVILS